MSTKYLQLPPESNPPAIDSLQPFRALIIVDEECSTKWQKLISTWLANSGCLYMMAWGIDCSSWDTAVDLANIEKFDYQDIPAEEFIVTTWHADEPLDELFWFSKNLAHHALINLRNTLILHISTNNRENEILAAYVAA